MGAAPLRPLDPTASSSDARHVVRVLGPLLVDDGERSLGPADLGGVRPKQVLEILLAARGHSVPVDRLTELLWGDAPPRDAHGSLQTFVSVLRRHLASDRGVARRLVVTETEAYRFATASVRLDIDRFDELLEASASQPTSAARRSLEQALELVRGEVFEDEPYAAWATDLRGSYQGRILGARLDAAEHALAERDLAPALAHAAAAIALDDFSERAQRSEMLALYALGRAHEALARYRAFRSRLAGDLGLEPTAETRALEAAILRQDDVDRLLPRPIRHSHVERDASSPGLLGRGSELQTLGDAIRRALDGDLALIHVEGDAGLGKTRLLDELVGTLHGVSVGRTRATELESHLPYVPLAAALRDALPGGEQPAGRPPALAHVLPELALDSPGRAFDELEVLEALVAVVADHAPLVLVIDDLQWADARTIAALGYLRRRGTGLRVAVVTAARPPADHPLAGLEPTVRVRLEPLSPDDLAAIAVPGLHERTGGHPGFVAEALASAPGAEPSSTLAEALVAQCRAEGPFGYRVLVAAAIVEQPFDPEPVADLVDADPAALTEELERLCERRILRVDGMRFRFRYDLVRQALLGSTSPARQRLLHERLEGGRAGRPDARAHVLRSRG